MDPATYRHDHAPHMIAHLCSHLVRNHFFRSLLELLKLKAPPPEDAEATPTPLAESLLGYLTRPLVSGREDGGVYVSLANEILSLSLSPHVSYYVLPHLRRSDVDLPVLVKSVLGGVASGGVASSLQLLYSILELTHSRLPSLGAELLESYLQLVSVLLSEHTPSVPMETGGGVAEEDWEEMEVDGGEDPLACPEAMLRHCLAALGGPQIAETLQQRTSLAPPTLSQLCSVCYQMIRHHRTLPYTRTRLFQFLALKPRLLSQLWTHLSQMNIKRTFG